MLVLTLIDAAFVFEAEAVALLSSMVSRFVGRLQHSQAAVNQYHQPPELNFADQYSYMLKM
jgi:hypothetical protein